MRLNKAIDDKKLDVRLRDKHITEGKISSADVTKVVAELPDDANNLLYTADVEQKRQDAANAPEETAE